MSEPVGAAATPEKPEIKVIPPKTIVRKLAVGQEVKGRVRRLTDFGAFIDIGVGTDGLVHVSEISPKRISKPADVLKVGQEVTAWIKELDKEKDRISLTLIPPDAVTLRTLQVGQVLTGKVTRIESYGVFVDIGVGHDGMVHIKELAHGFVKHPGDVVKVGDEIEVQVLKVNRRRGQIDLSRRAVLPPPPPEPPPAPKAEKVANEAPSRPGKKAGRRERRAGRQARPTPPADSAASADEMTEAAAEDESSVPTAFEIALQRAQQQSTARQKKPRAKKAWYEQDEDDDVVARTLMLADD
ncbi:MAG: S1 RNA-binding domain-containing protein [Anaerolineae bacterium]|nr:S1 RNA-binding domain-containing protein [Caldilineales bacterium]MCX7853628.1 S1 RNA-binding domain-containing protein [Caldilineales bacterium]MDW8268200.1 S1 RNA-binding domain-containing protein [Anaerolineae bacterium]